jgi:putative ABC transport system ATP-binding protein
MPLSAGPDHRPERPALAARVLRLDGVVVERGRRGEAPLRALDIAALEIAPGSLHGVRGPSGAGKSTLLDLVAGLLAPARGALTWGEERLDRFSEAARLRWRRDTVGFVFQDFHLVDELSVLENVLMPARFAACRVDTATRARARELIAAVGLPDAGRRATRLSRGERQRVAVARALLAAPPLLLADEPTASLDAETGDEVARLLVEAARAGGATLLVASHDPALLARLEHVHHLVAGRLVAEPSP